MNTKSIGDKIRQARVIKSLSQENLASELGISVGAYSNIERGKSKITVDRLQEISRILKINIVDFFAGNPISTNQTEAKTPLKYVPISDTEYLEISQMREELRVLKKEVASLKRSKRKK